jgi:hypothetical protein
VTTPKRAAWKSAFSSKFEMPMRISSDPVNLRASKIRPGFRPYFFGADVA